MKEAREKMKEAREKITKEVKAEQLPNSPLFNYECCIDKCIYSGSSITFEDIKKHFQQEHFQDIVVNLGDDKYPKYYCAFCQNRIQYKDKSDKRSKMFDHFFTHILPYLTCQYCGIQIIPVSSKSIEKHMKAIHTDKRIQKKATINCSNDNNCNYYKFEQKNVEDIVSELEAGAVLMKGRGFFYLKYAQPKST